MHYSQEQAKDSEILQLRQFLSHGELPDCPDLARKIAAQAHSFALVDDIVYLIDAKRNNQRRCAVPTHLRASLMHGGESQRAVRGALLWGEVVQGPGSALVVALMLSVTATTVPSVLWFTHREG